MTLTGAYLRSHMIPNNGFFGGRYKTVDPGTLRFVEFSILHAMFLHAILVRDTFQVTVASLK